MSDRLISPQEAQRKMGITSKSSFWDIIARKKVERVEYSPTFIRFWESKIDALIAQHTVSGPFDRARLADGRRS